MLIDTELDADLVFLERLRRMRSDFFARIVGASRTTDEDVLSALRQEPVYQLAEFLFALRANGVDTVAGMRELARLHNDHLLALRGDRDRLLRFGLTLQRVEAALFTADNLDKLAANYATHAQAIDQSDLGRFLVTVMSAETCRKLVVAADAAGFVTRERSPYGAMLVRSSGTMEDIFGQVLREARRDD